MTEFALVLPLFVALLVAAFDIGKGIYTSNGVAQAAREIGRATSVHRGSPLSTSTDTAETLAVQKGLVPGLGDPTFACVDVAGNAVTGACTPGNYLKVTIAATYRPVVGSFMFGLADEFILRSTSVVEISNSTVDIP
jgi:Flp pilus assembly protein TadG